MLLINKHEREELARILEKEFAHHRLGGFESIALDVAYEELWLSEKKAGAEFPEPARRAYLRKAAKNIILNEIERHKNLVSIDHEPEHFENDPALADTDFEKKEMDKIEIDEAVDALPENLKQVIVRNPNDPLVHQWIVC